MLRHCGACVLSKYRQIQVTNLTGRSSLTSLQSQKLRKEELFPDLTPCEKEIGARNFFTITRCCLRHIRPGHKLSYYSSLGSPFCSSDPTLNNFGSISTEIFQQCPPLHTSWCLIMTASGKKPQEQIRMNCAVPEMAKNY